MELNLGGMLWRVLFAVVAIVVFLISRRPTMAQRATEAIGALAVFGAAWVLVIGVDLQAFSPFVVTAAVAFGLLASAEARR
jgi:hypothetical protein